MFALFNIWFGELPEYFDFFAKSCSFNKNWKWFLFTNLVKQKKDYNDFVTLIPYDWDDLHSDCYFLKNINYKVDTRWNERQGSHGNLTIWPKNGWPCRLYIAKKYKEIWKNYNFIGTFDCDIIYGDLNLKMPQNIQEYGMITGHTGRLHPTNKNPRICFPFTIFNKNCFDDVFDYVEKRDFILDANYEFSAYFAKKHKIFCGNNIQPIGETVAFNEKRVVIWKKGKLFINNIEGGFYHFMDEKNNNKFDWNLNIKNDYWIIKNNKIRTLKF
jgi:hypothetical protein